MGNLDFVDFVGNLGFVSNVRFVEVIYTPCSSHNLILRQTHRLHFLHNVKNPRSRNRPLHHFAPNLVPMDDVNSVDFSDYAKNTDYVSYGGCVTNPEILHSTEQSSDWTNRLFNIAH